MYGLADRIARSAIHQNQPTPVVELAPRGTIMVVDRDPAMLAMVRSSLEGSCHIVVARHAGEALSQIEWARPEAVLADAGLGADELDLLARGLATLGCDHLPIVTIDPSRPVGPSDLRRIAARALGVTSRVWLNGGLRERIAA